MTLSPQNFPRFLYKYRSGSDLDIATLRKGSVFVPNFYGLNDIFESNFEFELSNALEYAYVGTPIVLRNGYGEPAWVPILGLGPKLSGDDLDRRRKALENAIRNKREQVFNKGVYCLSAENDHELMWAHYADSYKGYCIEYDLEKSNPSSSEFRGPYGVEYVENPPKLPWFLVDQYPEWSLWYHMIGHKSKRWKYEQEFRLIYSTGNLEYKFPFNVSAIIFGPKASDSLKENIFGIFGKDVKYRECIHSSEEYKLKIIESQAL